MKTIFTCAQVNCGKPIAPHGEGDAAQGIVRRIVQDLGA